MEPSRIYASDLRINRFTLLGRDFRDARGSDPVSILELLVEIYVEGRPDVFQIYRTPIYPRTHGPRDIRLELAKALIDMADALRRSASSGLLLAVRRGETTTDVQPYLVEEG